MSRAACGIIEVRAGFCDGLTSNTEWSLACPGIGMALDCWAALMSDLAGEAEGMESFVGPAGFTPSTVLLGSTAGPGVGGNVLDNGGIHGFGEWVGTLSVAGSTALIVLGVFLLGRLAPAQLRQ